VGQIKVVSLEQVFLLVRVQGGKGPCATPLPKASLPDKGLLGPPPLVSIPQLPIFLKQKAHSAKWLIHPGSSYKHRVPVAAGHAYAIG